MSKNRTPISKAGSYIEMGEFWDSHDLSEVWEKTRPAEVEVELQSERLLYSVAKDLAKEIEHIAHSQGVSSGTLVNLWLQEKIQQARAR
jgi:hypothetical protein